MANNFRLNVGGPVSYSTCSFKLLAKGMVYSKKNIFHWKIYKIYENVICNFLIWLCYRWNMFSLVHWNGRVFEWEYWLRITVTIYKVISTTIIKSFFEFNIPSMHVNKEKTRVEFTIEKWQDLPNFLQNEFWL